MQLTGAQLIVQLLERQGINIVAGIPGGANLPLYDALSQTRTIRHVLARHEQGAGFMAQGMARVTGRPAVCIATSGPGATNILTAIADAKLDSIPVVCITGQVSRPFIGTDAFQEVDTYGMSIPITKHNYLIRSPEELLEVLPEAFRIAASGRPGPVLVDVPKDVQAARIEVKDWPAPGTAEAPPAFDPAQVQQAAKLIREARRPILYLGGGIVHSNAADQARALVRRNNLPTVMTLLALGAIPVDADLSLGMLGMHAAPCANLAMEECDLLIVAGARFDDRATGKVSHFCRTARIIHIDIDESELHKIRPADVAIRGDVGQVLAALLTMLDEDPRTEWVSRIAEFKRTHPLDTGDTTDVTNPYGLILTAASLLDDEAIICTDVGQHQMFTAQCYPFRRPRQLLTSGGLGTMGFGLPSAIGAALARPDTRVVSFSGDGSLLMNIQELATAAEEGVNVKVIVMNNNALGLVRQQQNLFYSQHYMACDYRINVDFVQIARGFGIEAFDLGKSHDPRSTLAAAFEHPGPCLVNAPVAADHHVLPMVPPGAANIDMIGRKRTGATA